MRKIFYNFLISSYIIASPLLAMQPSDCKELDTDLSKKRLSSSDENDVNLLSTIREIGSNFLSQFSPFPFFGKKEEEKEEKVNSKILCALSHSDRFPIDLEKYFFLFLNQSDMLNILATSKICSKMRPDVWTTIPLHLGYNLSNFPCISALTSLTSLTLRTNDMSSLKHLTNLRSLSLLWSDLSNERLEVLLPFPNLTRLTLNNCQLASDLNLSHFTKLQSLGLHSFLHLDLNNIANLTNLTWLGLRRSHILNVQITSKLINLTSLDLNAINTENDNLQYLLRLTNLTDLALPHCESANLSTLSHLTSLTSLDLGLNMIDHDIIVNILCFNNLINLTWLNLSLTNFADARLCISSLKKLTSLRCSYSSTEGSLDCLSPLTNLNFLHLEGSQLPHGASILNDFTNLTHLDLHDNRLDSSFCFNNLINLTWLKLNVSMANDDDVLLQNLSLLTGLTELHMRASMMTHGGTFLNNLINLKSLEMKISKGRGTLHLSKLENLTHLRMNITYPDNNVEVQGFSQLTKLKSLECNFPKIDGDSMQWLCPLTNLRSLKLERKNIEDFSSMLIDFKYLVELQVLPGCHVKQFLCSFGNRYITFCDKFISAPIDDDWINLKEVPRLSCFNGIDINSLRMQMQDFSKDEILQFKIQN